MEVAMREAPRPEAERVAPHRQKSRKRPKESKRVRTDPSSQASRRREAEVTVESLEEQVTSDLLAAAVADDEEMDHEGNPTLHSIPLASYREWSKWEVVLDEKTKEVLEPEKAQKARMRELTKMEEQDMPLDEVKKRGLKIVKSRWVDTRKALPDDPRGVRSRLVGQEINFWPT